MAQPRQRRRRDDDQRELIAWLDEQARNLEQFEPAEEPRNNPQDLDFEQFIQVYDRVDRWAEHGRRIVRFRFTTDLEKLLVARILNKIKQHVHTRHAIAI